MSKFVHGGKRPNSGRKKNKYPRQVLVLQCETPELKALLERLSKDTRRRFKEINEALDAIKPRPPMK